MVRNHLRILNKMNTKSKPNSRARPIVCGARPAMPELRVGVDGSGIVCAYRGTRLSNTRYESGLTKKQLLEFARRVVPSRVRIVNGDYGNYTLDLRTLNSLASSLKKRGVRVGIEEVGSATPMYKF